MPKMNKIYTCIRIIYRGGSIEANNSIWMWFCYISSVVEKDKWVPTQENSGHLARAPALILPLSFFLIADCRQVAASLG